MFNIKNFTSKHPYLSSIILFIFSSFFILLAMQTIELQSIVKAFSWIFTHPTGTLCTIFLLCIVMTTILAICKLLFISYLIPAIFCFVLEFVNYFKCVINSAPLVLSDFTLASQFGEVTGYAKSALHFSFQSVLAIVIFIFCALIILLADIILRIKFSKRGHIVLLITDIVLILIVVISPVFTSLTDKISTQFITQEERNEQFGVFYGLYCAYSHSRSNKEIESSANIDDIIFIPTPSDSDIDIDNEKIDSPNDDEYLDSVIEPSDSLQPDDDEPIIPNVIFLMSESFFDITRLPNITFSQDPVANYHKLAEEYTSGSFLTPAYCGGTAYVEMEVLTGLTSYLLNESDTLTSFPSELYAELPTVQSEFDAAGYNTIFFHSHTNALYNRDPIYHSMGFDQVLFSDSCGTDAEIQGGYVSDAEFSRKIISLYEERDPEVPLFMLNVSMENHQPYRADKYSEPSGIKAESEYLNETDLSIIDSYVMGVHHADESLKTLVDYFDTVDEPVMLVFWGDHLPNLKLSDGHSIFQKLEYASSDTTTNWDANELKQMLSTEYLIWTNYEDKDEMIPDHTESCTFLGVHVLEHLNMELNPYFEWLQSSVMPYMTLYRARLFVDGSGMPYSEIPDEYVQMLEAYRIMEHDLMYGDKKILYTNNE